MAAEMPMGGGAYTQAVGGGAQLPQNKKTPEPENKKNRLGRK
jgi:hypothetical protein